MCCCPVYRDLQQELAAVQAKCQQQQQQLADAEERVLAAGRKLEQQGRAHEAASRRAADKAERKLQQLKEQLAAKEAAIRVNRLPSSGSGMLH